MIKRFFIATLALAFLTSQVLASDWLINSYRFAAPPSFITLRGQAEGQNSDGTALTVSLPAGTAQNDVVYVSVCSDRSGTDQNMSLTTTGYTELVDIFQTDTNASNMGVYRKLMGASPDTSVTASGTANSGQAETLLVIVLTGVDTTAFEDATTTTAQAPNASAPDPPSITTVTANAWVLAMGCSTQPDAGSVQTNYSNFDSITTAGGRPAGGYLSTREIASPGAENPGAFGGISGTTSDSWTAATVAVRPQ